MDTKSGPRDWMHHDITANAIPEPTMPYTPVFVRKMSLIRACYGEFSSENAYDV
jgi:hypothetical protein